MHSFDKVGVIGLLVENIRCDNAGENKDLEETFNGEKWKLNINFEYTARDTPQQNSLVETGFYIVLNKGRAMLIDSNVPYNMRHNIMQEALSTTTKLDGLVVS